MSDLEPITQEETAWAEGNLEPITRKEQYLNRLTGEEQDIPDEPITRTEQYLAKLCGEEIEIPSSPITREETYLAYLNGENVTLPEPITRLEQFMAFAAGESETKPTPLTREEFYWDKYQGGEVLKDFPGLPASIVTVTDAVAKPLDSLKVAITPVQEGSGDPSPDNIRPIRGWTGADIVVAGENVFDKDAYTVGNVTFKDARNVSATRSGIKIKLPNGTYTFKCFNETVYGYIYVYKNNGGNYIADYKLSILPSSRWQTHVITINTGDELFLVAAVGGSTLKLDMNLEIVAGNEEPTAYIPYTGQDYTITFPSEAGTVYGGTLDVTNGVLTVTKANIASYDGETLPGAWISDRDVYAEGTTPTTGAQVVYDLETPITYQLTQTEVQMLLGTNNIWADTGDILEGKYYGKRSSATRAMMNTLRSAGEITEITPEEPEETEENDER